MPPLFADPEAPPLPPRSEPRIEPRIEPREWIEPRFELRIEPRIEPRERIEPRIRIEPLERIETRERIEPRIEPRERFEPRERIEPRIEPRERIGPRIEPRERIARRPLRLLLAFLAAFAAAALGAAGAAAFVGLRRGQRPPQVATAAHVLLSAGSLTVPSGPGWRYEEGINGVFLSSDVQMTAGKLQVTSGGLFLLYGQFAVTCTAPPCPPGTVTLQLWRRGSPRPLLAVPLTLPNDSGSDPARSALVQAVGQLQTGDVLSLAVAGDVAGDEWQLAQDEREDNFVGLLRIAGG